MRTPSATSQLPHPLRQLPIVLGKEQICYVIQSFKELIQDTQRQMKRNLDQAQKEIIARLAQVELREGISKVLPYRPTERLVVPAPNLLATEVAILMLPQ